MYVYTCMYGYVNVICIAIFVVAFVVGKILCQCLTEAVDGCRFSVGNVCQDSVERFFGHIRKLTVRLTAERAVVPPARPVLDRRPSARDSSDELAGLMWTLLPTELVLVITQRGTFPLFYTAFFKQQLCRFNGRRMIYLDDLFRLVIFDMFGNFG